MGLFKDSDKLELPISRNFIPKEESYDAIIIGAGMSGIAASIRLAMYDKKVLLLERHTISGGLNSYYSRRKRDLDVGLHALTNFASKGERRKPLTKLLKQLRIPYDSLELYPQKMSQVSFPDIALNFSNDCELLRSEIATNFPDQIDGYDKLLRVILEFNEVALDNETIMAKDLVGRYITNPLLKEMIFCPLLIYGSAWENDMDFSQFVIMFKSIFLEGFGRARGGVRRIIKILLDRAEEVGAELCFRNGVKQIITKGSRAIGVETSKGQVITAPLILSCAGFPETLSLCDEKLLPQIKPSIGKLSFTETILTVDKRPKEIGQDKTIIFHNDSSQYFYQRPKTLIDPRSAVICLPNNFDYDDYQEGVYRITLMANYGLWKDLLEEGKTGYNQKKEEVLHQSLEILKKYVPLEESEITFSDVFTPTTVERYTGHLGGCVYGTPDKSRMGTTPIDGLYLCGTDQGFLGIIGSMLSGISMANLHGLMNETATTQAESFL